MRDMPPNAQDAFNAWLLKVEIVAGGTCLLFFAVCLAVAIIFIAKSKKRDE